MAWQNNRRNSIVSRLKYTVNSITARGKLGSYTLGFVVFFVAFGFF